MIDQIRAKVEAKVTKLSDAERLVSKIIFAERWLTEQYDFLTEEKANEALSRYEDICDEYYDKYGVRYFKTIMYERNGTLLK